MLMTSPLTLYDGASLVLLVEDIGFFTNELAQPVRRHELRDGTDSIFLTKGYILLVLTASAFHSIFNDRLTTFSPAEWFL